MTDVDVLKKQLKEAQVEIGNLQLRLSNVTLMLKKEMQASGKLPKSDEIQIRTQATI
jgi:hypothetical protein